MLRRESVTTQIGKNHSKNPLVRPYLDTKLEPKRENLDQTMTSYLVAIVGASGSGKSTVAKTLIEHMRAMGYSIEHVSQDDFYNPVGHPLTNYDHPNALDLSLLANTLESLKSGLTVDIPTYDFVSHRRQRETRRIQTSDIVVVEGLFLLTDPSLRRLFDSSIFLDVSDDICFQRRLERDQVERGRLPDDIERQYHKQVKPGYDDFIAPFKSHASIVIEALPEDITAFIDVVFVREESVHFGPHLNDLK